MASLLMLSVFLPCHCFLLLSLCCPHLIFFSFGFDQMAAVDAKKNVIVTISSDKGLCGGINSTAVKISKSLHKLNSGIFCKLMHSIFVDAYFLLLVRLVFFLSENVFCFCRSRQRKQIRHLGREGKGNIST